MEQMALTIEEASRISGIGRTKIYEAINAGRLPAKKHSKRTLILHEDLKNFLAALPSYKNAKALEV